MIVLLVYILSILFSVVVLLWIFVPTIYGLPPVPTKPGRIRNTLKLANLQPNEVVYDLGAGDGRVLLIAARDFGAKAVGVEVGPIQCAWIWLRVRRRRVGESNSSEVGEFLQSRSARCRCRLLLCHFKRGREAGSPFGTADEERHAARFHLC